MAETRKAATKRQAKAVRADRKRTPKKREAPARRIPRAEVAARQAVIDAALEMSRSGLSPGRSGNVSLRYDVRLNGQACEGMLITPSGMAYESLAPADIVFVAHDGGVEPGSRVPSSEWRFHLSAYLSRGDCGGVVHTHSMYATVLACAHKPIPAFHYMVAAAGGAEIPLVPYALFGTQELADHVATGLRAHDACLMANHGQIAIGSSLSRALELAHEVETLAAQYVKLLGVGAAHVLNDAQMEDVLARFQGYGQRAQSV